MIFIFIIWCKQMYDQHNHGCILFRHLYFVVSISPRGAGILLIGWIWWSISCIYDVIYDVTVHIEGVSRV